MVDSDPNYLWFTELLNFDFWKTVEKQIVFWL